LTILPETAPPDAPPPNTGIHPLELIQDPTFEVEPRGPFTALRRMLPKGEVIRFLMVGGCNTLFSYLLYAGFGALFTHLLPRLSQVWIADVALVCSTPVAITFSFLGLKHFVFRTRGNYLKEWLKCFAVYSVTVPASLVIIGVATKLFLLTPIEPKFAKYLAGIVNSGTIASYSYFAHKKFSFKR
jgi:putative flippase GtrA